MRLLLVDNYDSYTYNLFQLLWRATGVEPVVLRNDDRDWERLCLDDFDGVVISPGPGHPGSRRDFGHSRTVLERGDIPVLGVCLGHQGMGLVAGGRVGPAPSPRHGHLTTVCHSGRGLFQGLPQGFVAVRYHSLCIEDPLPSELEAQAWAEDGVVMAVNHRRLPWWGVQFHPESISTECGEQIVDNFRRLAFEQRPRRAPASFAIETARPALHRADREWNAAPPLTVISRCLEELYDSADVFARLYAESDRAFWLDSALVEVDRSRFSFMGCAEGSAAEVITYRVGDDHVIVDRSRGPQQREAGTIFEVLTRRLVRELRGSEALPFQLPGGYVGYFGYELKALLGGTASHASDAPDATWIRADRFVAFDHLEGRTYVVALAEPRAVDEARAWTERIASRIRVEARRTSSEEPLPISGLEPAALMVRSEKQYLADIEECLRCLRAGESYEICLTNKVRLPAPADDLEYYLRLRKINPAPYAAFVRYRDLTIFSSSPERFLRVDADGVVESRPIKGTAARDNDSTVDQRLRESLAQDAKTRAENLMIVDLVRNDLGRVCEVGSVTVPHFMATESYATVHQLVSTIRGRLRPETSPIDCIKACFPPGSMTGAPKLRTMEIIDALENEARGVYSGALGFLGFSGTADLSVVIRTAVRWRDNLSVGAGGAIVLDSDPDAELREMLLKARTPLRGLPLTPWQRAVAS